MKRRLKLVAAIVLAVAMVVSLPLIGCKTTTTAATTAAAETTAAVATTAAVTEPVTLNFWLYGGAPENVKLYHALVDQWNSANKNIQVVITDQVWDTVFQHFQNAATTNTLPDIARIQAPYACNAFGALGGYIYPLDNFADFPEVKSTFTEGYIEALNFKGHYWGLPNSLITFILNGNKKMFDDAGITELPKTWDELRVTAKKLTKEGQYGYGLMGGDLGGFAYRLVEYAFKAGGGVLNDDWTKTTVNTEAWISALQLMIDMKKDGSIDPAFLTDNFTDLANKFAANKVAMSIEGPYWVGVIKPINPATQFLFGIVPEPSKVAGDQKPGTLSDASAIVITNTSKYKEQAWEFVKFINNQDADKAFLNVDLGGLPLLKSTVELPEWKNYAGYDAYQAEGPSSKPWPYHEQLVEITRDVIAQICLQAIDGKITAEEAMKQCETKINEILARK